MAKVKRIPIAGLKAGIRLDELINGCRFFTWAEALRNGERMPENSLVTANIIQAANAFDVARDALGEPMIITSWYRDPESNAAAGGVSNSTHTLGTGIDFYCASKESGAVYDILDPIWTGGMGYYEAHIHIDISSARRW